MSAFLFGRLEARREASQSEGAHRSATPPKDVRQRPGRSRPERGNCSLHRVRRGLHRYGGERDRRSGSRRHRRLSLKWAFYGLVVLAAALYVFGHLKAGAERRRWDRLDYPRMLIPPLAFVGWAMALQPSTMFDAAFSLDDGTKVLLVVFGGTVLVAAASLLGVAADKEDGGGRPGG